MGCGGRNVSPKSYDNKELIKKHDVLMTASAPVPASASASSSDSAPAVVVDTALGSSSVEVLALPAAGATEAAALMMS